MRLNALSGIAKLEQPPYVPDQVSANAWMNLAEISRRAASDPDTLAKTLIGIGCTRDGAPYVISGLIQQLDDRFKGKPSQEPAVARAFLNEKSCLGAQGLTAVRKADLQEIVDRASKPSPGPGTTTLGAVGSR
jgi:hypothetical protein